MSDFLELIAECEALKTANQTLREQLKTAQQKITQLSIDHENLSQRLASAGETMRQYREARRRYLE